MKIYHLADLIDNPNSTLPPSILTIGNFDGVHLGHQAMIQMLINTAQQQQLASAVMVFEPQPREFFNPATAPTRLTNFAEKSSLLQQLGVDFVIVAKFDDKFRQLSAQQFANYLLQLNVKRLVLGDDFRFGQDRLGDSEFLRDFGLPVENLPTIVDDYQSQRISSTRVRDCLANGDLQTAKNLLGRDYAITGDVVGGDKIGRTLAFPTANIALNRIKPALHGVFAVSVSATDGTDLRQLAENGNIGLQGLTAGSLFGTANVGIRPSVDKGDDWRLEVHFPEFSADLYGKQLTVTFLHFLHGEKKYANLEALKIGIQQDVTDLLAWYRTHLL